MHEFSPSKWERWYEIRGNKQNSHRHKLPIMISSHTCAHRRNSVVHQTLQHSHISQSAKNALRKSFPLFYIFMAYSWFLFHYISLLRRCNAMLVTVMVLRYSFCSISLWGSLFLFSPFIPFIRYISSYVVPFWFRPAKQINGVQTWTRNSHPLLSYCICGCWSWKKGRKSGMEQKPLKLLYSRSLSLSGCAS